MKPTRHIFFDLDHTLWDFERNACETISELIEEYRRHIGHHVDPANFYSIYSRINRSLWDAFERKQIEMSELRKNRWQQAFAEVDVETGLWIKEFEVEYAHRCPQKPHVMEGAIELLEHLKDDYGLGIISNGIAVNQFTKLDRSGLRQYFSDVVTLDLVGVPKPDPKIFELALARAGMDAENSMYIGDSYEADVVGGKEAGMSVIFFNPERQENRLGAVEVQHMSEIPGQLPNAWAHRFND